jgi:hypothetical protein
MNWIWVTSLVITAIIIALIPFAVSALETIGIFFTCVESGNIKFITRGNSLAKIVHDVKGMKLENGLLIPGTERKWFWNTRFGLWWVGFPPFSRVHTFPITKERENPEGKTSEDWIDRDDDEAVISSLRFTFPRPYVLKDVELADRIPIDLLVIAKFEVVNPYIPVFNFKGKFFENAGADLRGAVIDIVKGLTLDAFIDAPKGETGGILETMKNPTGSFNLELIKQVGLKLVGISIPQYDSSDKKVRAAMNAQTVAEEEAKGKIAEANGYATQLAIRAEADGKAKERLAAAEGVRVKEIMNQLKISNASPDALVQTMGTILEAEALTGETSKLTTLVKGNAPVVVPIK